MSIEFEIKIPDQPYKNSFILDKRVKLIYQGPRYIVISVFKDTGIVSTYEGMFDTLEEINLENYVDDDCNFYVIDAHKHPLEACFLTHLYENEEVDNYEETLPTGEVWTYPYETHILGNVYANEMPTYNNSTDEFSSLKYLTPAISKEDFFNSIKLKISYVENILAQDTETTLADLPEDIKKYNEELQTYLEWLKNVKTTYYGVEHWKIPFISEPRK